jgi:PBP1b-binding outer membrane lipoprotein LpoB
MKKTALAFAVLLAICLVIGACSKQEEVEKPAETIPQAAEQVAPDTMMDTGMVVDTTMIDTMKEVPDTTGAMTH